MGVISSLNNAKNPLLKEYCEQNGLHLFSYSLTDSTNTRAKEYANGAESDGKSAIFITRAQSAGRGTRGRSFESPDGAGLYMSILFYPDVPASSAALITTYAATAVCRAVLKISPRGKVEPKIKWVNDVYLGEKKLSGILTEGKPRTDGILSYAIVGIGINVKSNALPESLADIATSLEDNGIITDTDRLSLALTEEFFENLDTLGSAEAMAEYRERSMLRGRTVRVSFGDTVEDLTVTDIGEDGSLITLDGEGNIKKFTSADATLLKK